MAEKGRDCCGCGVIRDCRICGEKTKKTLETQIRPNRSIAQSIKRVDKMAEKDRQGCGCGGTRTCIICGEKTKREEEEDCYLISESEFRRGRKGGKDVEAKGVQLAARIVLEDPRVSPNHRSGRGTGTEITTTDEDECHVLLSGIAGDRRHAGSASRGKHLLFEEEDPGPGPGPGPAGERSCAKGPTPTLSAHHREGKSKEVLKEDGQGTSHSAPGRDLRSANGGPRVTVEQHQGAARGDKSGIHNEPLITHSQSLEEHPHPHQLPSAAWRDVTDGTALPPPQPYALPPPQPYALPPPQPYSPTHWKLDVDFCSFDEEKLQVFDSLCITHAHYLFSRNMSLASFQSSLPYPPVAPLQGARPFLAKNHNQILTNTFTTSTQVIACATTVLENKLITLAAAVLGLNCLIQGRPSAQ